MPIIGTAGHVDHGKSTLVERLTGRDPDRWAEEKQRGLTIDLGFAWTTFPNGETVSFVDVPGHARFMKNMLSGVDAFDVALFVVAADEGWSVQSEEHLRTLEALGCTNGVVAVTKIDAVDQDLAELAELEVAERFATSTLKNAPVIGVSAHTGVGIPELVAYLERSLESIPPSGDRPHLWVDRSFSVPGAGTVVTGSLRGGDLSVGEDLANLFSGETIRIRSLQQHEQEVERAASGSRVAISVSGAKPQDVSRGVMLGQPGQWVRSDRFLASVPEAISTGSGALHLHLGSGAWLVEASPTSETTAVLSLPVKIPITAGTRFLLRDVGAQAVVGGGTVLNPTPALRLRDIRPTTSALEAAVEAGPDEAAAQLLEVLGSSTQAALSAASGGGIVAAKVVGELVLSPGLLERLTPELTTMVERYHHQYPLHEGVVKAHVATQLNTTHAVISHLVASNPGLTEVSGSIAESGFEPKLSEEAEQTWPDVEQRLSSAGLTALSQTEVGLSQDEEHLRNRRGDVTTIGGFVFHPAALSDMVSRLGELPDSFSISEFRDHFELTRKYAVPLAEWLDNELITRRAGDLRSLRGFTPN